MNDNVSSNKEVSSDKVWWYIDPSGQKQGPFNRLKMTRWFVDGYFSKHLRIGCDDSKALKLK